MQAAWRDLSHIDWRAIPIAAFVGGTVFLLVNVILTPIVLEVEPTLFLRYIAALVMGNDVLTEDQTYTLFVGVGVHYILSILFTLVIAVVVHRWGMMVGVVGGAILGLALYGINLYTLTVFFEWFFAINSDVLLLSHVLFGATVGGVYELFDHYDLALEVSRETA